MIRDLDMDHSLEIGTIQDIIRLFRHAFARLRVAVPVQVLEHYATMVHEAMTVQTRSFHTPEHIFNLADGSNPIQALAALFHDVVYYEVDDGFTSEVGAVLAPYIHVDGPDIYLTALVNPDDIPFRVTMEIFGFRSEQLLAPNQGRNEFLSALLMYKKLHGILRARDLIRITACIEATIPFRSSSDNESPAVQLEHRIAFVDRRYGLGMTPHDIVETVKEAVRFSNKDVANFAEQDTGRFLDNTWKLLPESNPSLRTSHIYSIRSYRRAIQGMETFLHQLNPDTIFMRYDDVPSDGEHSRMVALAYRNVFTARQYLGLKLLAMATLEALAEISGGDAPVALFMGDLRESSHSGNIEDFLPKIGDSNPSDTNSTLFGLLAFGRASSSSFDMQNSPLSLYLYTALGWDVAQQKLAVAKRMFEGEVSPKEFLDELPSDVITAIAKACASLASTRGLTLLSYADTRRV